MTIGEFQTVKTKEILSCIVHMYRDKAITIIQFFRAFSSVVRQLPRAKPAKTGHGPQSS